MTPTDIDVLMNRYFDNDLTDAEEEMLFLHLSRSQESRTVFAALKTVYGALQHPAAVTYPASLDRKLGALNVGQNVPRPMQKSITISIPSAVYSIGAVVMMSFFIYVVGVIQERNISAKYLHSFNAAGQQRAFSPNIN